MTSLIKVERLFKQLSCPSIVGAGKIAHGRVIDKFGSLNFYLNNITQNPTQKISLQMIDSKEFSYYMAGEANRFLLASMISLNRALSEENENLSWQIVEHYYSAYYAVHYLIRISGLSLTNIDKGTLKMILRTNLTGSTFNNVESGLNLMTYDRGCENITLEKKDKKGGSHIDAWSAWVSVVERIIIEADSDIQEYAETAVYLSEHLSFIKRSNDTFSPTVIRNEVNYQFANDAWCFDGLTKEKMRRVRKAISENKLSLNNSGDLVENLICNNNLIISLAKKTFNLASESNSKSICRSILNMYKRKIPTLIS
ncbi:hypothetical protein HN028_11180 [Pantoea ananatis]|uniref:hypothetical protein n=1 Tax=Pantoea ananas TaxID=553 RepID=UPI00352A2CE8